jgi:hypothetical protein
MTIKLVMMAAVYCAIVLVPRLAALSRTGAAGRKTA